MALAEDSINKAHGVLTHVAVACGGETQVPPPAIDQTQQEQNQDGEPTPAKGNEGANNGARLGT